MSLASGGNFLDFIQNSGRGASALFGAGDDHRPVGAINGDLFDFSSTGAARGGKGGGGPTTGGDTEPVTSVYITGQNDGIDDSQQFNIEIRFVGDWSGSPELMAVFEAAANYLAGLIAEDIPDAVDRYGNFYDDLVITADLDPIDGTGGILGQAGPTLVRTDSLLPALGSMTFDEADAAYYYSLGLFDDIVLHEMMHVMGFGTLWNSLNLVTNTVDTQGTPKPTDDVITSIYNGDQANSAYVGFFTTDDFLFVETDGGSGTAGGHWDEETYFDELMTGYIGHLYSDGTRDNTNYLSDWSVAALADLGYTLVDGASGIPNDIILA